MNQLVIEQPKHWLRGMSGNPRAMACSGCINEAAKWPAEPSGSAAIDGTHSHTLLENCLRNNVWEAGAFLQRQMADHEGQFVVDQDRVDRVQIALNYVAQRMREIPGVQIWIEEVVDAGLPYNIPDWKGTSDIILFAFDQAGNLTFLEVIDYKDGFVVVQPDTWQVVGYTIGALNGLLKPGASLPPVIRNTIIQPKDFKRQVKPKDYAAQDFYVRIEELIAGMTKTLDPNAPRTGGSHCKYCPGAYPGRCLEYNQMMVNTMNQALIPSGLNQPAAQQPFQVPQVGNLTNEQIAMFQDVRALMAEFMEKAEVEGIRRVKEEGQEIPGYEVEASPGKREYILPDDKLRAKFKSMGLVFADYLDEKIKSPAGIEKTKKYKEWSDRKKANFAALCQKKPGKDKLVPIADKAAAKEAKIDDLFGALPPPPGETKSPAETNVEAPAPGGLSFL